MQMLKLVSSILMMKVDFFFFFLVISRVSNHGSITT